MRPLNALCSLHGIRRWRILERDMIPPRIISGQRCLAKSRFNLGRKFLGHVAISDNFTISISISRKEISLNISQFGV
jgi:hypothetical protein